MACAIVCFLYAVDPSGIVMEGFKWLPVVRKPACYLSIGTDAFQMKEKYYYHQTNFWQNF
uniref:Uncharacterized protein n=1 Tax=Wuchereria bancrofti TaxID=6293 RepID=A0AAF5PJJ2_WUCBA